INNLADHAIGRRCPGSEPNGYIARTKPLVGENLHGTIDRFVAYTARGYDAVRVVDMVGGFEHAGYFAKMGCVAAVVASDYDHQIYVFADQFVDRILPILGSRANCIEVAESLGYRVLTVTLFDRFAKHFRDFERFTAQHRRLIGQADVLKIQVGVKTG